MLAASQRRVPGPRAVRGGTLLGFMIGLVAGMTIAVVVALFITRSPVPFVNKTGRTTERLPEPKSAAEAPDPNTPLYAKNRPAIPAEGPPPAAPQEHLSILERLFGKSASDTEPARPAEPAAVKGPTPAPDTRPADARTAADAKAPTGAGPAADAKAGAAAKPAAGADRVSYLLQAGAFRSSQDADGMRAKLAFLGFEAKVLSAEVNGQTVYRVRVGPYAQLDDMNKARSRLAENGVEVSVVRQR
jgi:cell division protein FtsN